MQVKLVSNGKYYEIMHYLGGRLQPIFSYQQLFTYSDAVELCESLHFKIINLKGDDNS